MQSSLKKTFNSHTNFKMSTFNISSITYTTITYIRITITLISSITYVFLSIQVYFILASAKIEVSLHCSVSTMSTHRQLQVLLCFPFHVPMLIDAHANIVQAIMMNARSVCTSHIPIYSKPFHSSQSQRVSEFLDIKCSQAHTVVYRAYVYVHPEGMGRKNRTLPASAAHKVNGEEFIS